MLKRRICIVLGLLSAMWPGIAIGTPAPILNKLLNDYATASGVAIADLSTDELQSLSDGQTVYRKVLTHGTGNTQSTQLRIVGYRLINKPRESLWLAALAYDAGYSKRLTEFLVKIHERGGASWYQHVNMPWPLRNRHWLIQTEKNIELANASEDRIWEHRWRLAENANRRIEAILTSANIEGLNQNKARDAIQLTVNDGAWVMARADQDNTLVVMHATMDMGGFIPDTIVARYTRRQLAAALQKIERDADGIWQHYDGRYIIHRGNGTRIQPKNMTPHETR